MFFKISSVKKYFVAFFVLAAIAALAYAGGKESVSFPTPLESYGDGEILIKKDEAQKNVRLLEDEGKKFLDEVKRVEVELATSIKEEDVLVKEFKELVGKVESSLEISDELDSILFACLTAAESRNLPEENPVPVRE